jgi:hypothetical protein
MNDKYKYYDQAVEYYSKLSKNRLYKINHKLFYSTHLTGPHLDFYYEPYGLNKNTPERNFKKFNKSILKSINNLSYCEKFGLYLNKSVITIMITQIVDILGTNKNYWLKYNFDDEIILDINKVYLFYKLFLETYQNRIPEKKSKNCEISYLMSLKTNLGLNVDPNDLQKLGIHRAKKIIKELEDLHKIPFSLIHQKYKTFGTSCESESELLTLVMKNILDLYNFSKQIFPNTLQIPEPDTIKLKWIPELKAKWSSKGKVSGRYLFLNGHNIQSYKKEQLMRLCAHETIPGHIMFRLNTNNFLKTYLSSKKLISPPQKISKITKKLLKSGTKTVNEGFASHIEKFILNIVPVENNLSTIKTTLLFNKLFHAIRMILDTGLNSENVTLKFTEKNATKILKTFTTLSDDGIKAEINKYYVNQGRACAYCFGNTCYDVIEQIYKKANKTNEFYSDIFTLQLPISLIFKYVDEKINK